MNAAATRRRADAKPRPALPSQVYDLAREAIHHADRAAGLRTRAAIACADERYAAANDLLRDAAHADEQAKVCGVDLAELVLKGAS